MGITIVSDFMNTKLITRSSDATVPEIARTMREFNISSVPIVNRDDHDRIVGIITERDIVRSISGGKPLERLKAESIMSSRLMTVRDDAPIEEAAYIMLKQKVRHLLVETATNSHKGIITSTDLARYLKQKMVPTMITTDGLRQESPSSGLDSEVWELFF